MAILFVFGGKKMRVYGYGSKLRVAASRLCELRERVNNSQGMGC
jgi:hypothetical protein